LAGQPSKLIQGKKLHRGHPEIREKVREEAEYVEAERRADGVEGVRRVKRKLRETGCVMDAGMSIPYVPLYKASSSEEGHG
jgi:ribonuclease P protein subunit POP4